MKAKKAAKRLNKAKLLLSSVIDQYTAETSAAGTRDLLRVAVSNIDQAQLSIHGTSALPTASTPKAGEVGEVAGKRRANISAEGRRRLSLAATKRWAAAKRKGARTLAAASPK